MSIRELKISGKKVTIHSNGQVFVKGANTGLFQWKTNPKRWSNSSGQEFTDLKGNSLEEVLIIKGFL